MTQQGSLPSGQNGGPMPGPQTRLQSFIEWYLSLRRPKSVLALKWKMYAALLVVIFADFMFESIKKTTEGWEFQFSGIGWDVALIVSVTAVFLAALDVMMWFRRESRNERLVALMLQHPDCPRDIQKAVENTLRNEK